MISRVQIRDLRFVPSIYIIIPLRWWLIHSLELIVAKMHQRKQAALTFSAVHLANCTTYALDATMNHVIL